MSLLVRTPYRRFLGSGVAGLLVGLGFAPWNLVVLGPVGLALIYLCLRPVGVRESLRLGATFGMVFYLIHTYWFAALHSLALPGVLLIIGIWFAAWAGICRGLDLGPFGMTVAWMGLEAGLTLGFFAFPWSRLADWTLWSASFAQPVSLVGEVGWGAFVALLGFGLGAVVRSGRRAGLAFGVSTLVLLLGVGFGYARIQGTDVGHYDRPVALVQPNVESTFDQAGVPEQLFQHAASLTGSETRPGDLVIWPESVVAAPLVDVRERTWNPRAQGNDRARRLRQLTAGEGRELVYGTVFHDPQPDKLDMLNGVVYLNREGVPAGVYAKRIPVPFGEYVPYMGQVEWVTRLARGVGVLGYRPGTAGGPFQVELGSGESTLGLLVCYEDVFSEYAREQAANGVDLFVSMANDSWSKSRGAHRQHFNRARMRALETGRPVLRVGNTGETGFVDPLGRTSHHLGAYERGVVRARPPRPLDREPPFQRAGARAGLLVALLLAGGEWIDARVVRVREEP